MKLIPERTVFVDTGPLVALYHECDPGHEEASKLFASLDSRKTHYVTTSLVLSEVLTMLGHNVGHKPAGEIARGLLASRLWTVLRPELGDELDALKWFTSFDDQEDLSFCDCVSFACMKKSKLKRAASFDHHFDMAKFERVFADAES